MKSDTHTQSKYLSRDLLLGALWGSAQHRWGDWSYWHLSHLSGLRRELGIMGTDHITIRALDKGVLHL